MTNRGGPYTYLGVEGPWDRGDGVRDEFGYREASHVDKSILQLASSSWRTSSSTTESTDGVGETEEFEAILTASLKRLLNIK